MANKHQVLELLAKGLTPQQIAKKLGCRPEYVRATRRRALVPGYAQSFESAKRKDALKTHLYRTDAKFRKEFLNYMRCKRKGLKADYPSVVR